VVGVNRQTTMKTKDVHGNENENKGNERGKITMKYVVAMQGDGGILGDDEPTQLVRGERAGHKINSL
jgi:hypothetical protein